MLGFRPRRIRLGRTNPSSPTLDFVSESTSFTKSYAPLASLKLRRSGQNAGRIESKAPSAIGGGGEKHNNKNNRPAPPDLERGEPASPKQLASFSTSRSRQRGEKRNRAYSTFQKKNFFAKNSHSFRYEQKRSD